MSLSAPAAPCSVLRRGLLRVLAALHLLALPALAQPADPPLALIGARVQVSPDGPLLEASTVLVRDGRISSIQPGHDPSAIPWDAVAVDVTGLTLTAGLLDGARQIELSFPQRDVQQGRAFDTGRDVLAGMPEAQRAGLVPERRAALAVPSGLSSDEALRKAGFTAVLAAPSGQALAGSGAWIALSGRPLREALVAPDAAQFGSLEWRTGPEDYQGERYPATLMGVMAHLRQVLLDAGHHGALQARSKSGLAMRPVPTDPVLQALLPVLSGEVLLILQASEEEDIRLVLGLADEFPGLRVAVAGALEAWELAEELALRRIPVLHALDFGTEPPDPDAVKKPARDKPKTTEGAAPPDSDAEVAREDDDAGDKAGDDEAGDDEVPVDEVRVDDSPWREPEPARLRRDRRERWLRDVAGPAVLHRAGVEVAFVSLQRSPAQLLDGLRLTRKHGGLSAADALAGLTTVPASVLGVERLGGEVRDGAAATLVAWEGTPLAKSARAAVLVVDGVLIDLRPGLPKRSDSADDDEDKLTDADEDPAATEETPAAEAGGDGDAVAAGKAGVELPVELDSDREPGFRTGGNVLIRGATLLTASRGTLERHDLLVRDGRIAAIGPGLTAPDGVRVVEAEGRFVMPGIIDCHSHVAIRGGINEWTRIVTPEVTIADEVDPDDVGIYRALAGGATAARLLHGSANAIGGRHEIIKFRWGGTAPELVLEGAPAGVKFALGENPRQSNYGSGTRFPKTRMGVEVVLRRVFEAARRYRDEQLHDAAERAAGRDPEPLRRDLRLEALAGILAGSIAIHSHCYQSEEMLMLLRLAEEHDLRVATLQHVLEGYKVAAEIAAHGAGASTFVDWWGFKFEVHDATPYNAALMARAGVNVSVNSDSDEHLRRLHLEAAKAIKYGGMDADEAVRTVTLNPAIQLGIEARVGSLDVGKDADFAIWSRHPFDVRTHCLMTFVDGELYFERRADVYDEWSAEIARRIEVGRERSDGIGSEAETAAAPRTDAAGRAVPDDASDALALPRHANRAPSNPPRPAPSAVALVGGRVHTLESGPDGELIVHDPGTVLLDGSLIRGVYAGADAAPAGYAVIDVTGLQVWPGLIDAGTGLGLQEIDTVAGSMDVREIGRDQPDLRAAAAYRADSEHIPVTRVNGTTAALVVPEGSRILGQSAVMALEGWTAAEALLLDAAALHVNVPRTAREEKDRAPTHGEEELLGCVDDHAEHACESGVGAAGPVAAAQNAPARARRGRGTTDSADDRDLARRVRDTWQELRVQFEASRDHARRVAEARRLGLPGPTPDPRLAALAPYALGQLPVVFQADHADQIADALDFAREQGLRPILAGGRDAWKVADRLALAECPVLLGPVLSLPLSRSDPQDAPFANAGLLHQAGVRLAFRSNSSAGARDLPYHAGMAVAHGLPEDVAVHALTLGAAQILGVADLCGSLTPGKRADIIVTDGSPLQITTQVRHLFIGGRDVGLASRHTRLAERYAERLADPGRPNRQ